MIVSCAPNKATWFCVTGRILSCSLLCCTLLRCTYWLCYNDTCICKNPPAQAVSNRSNLQRSANSLCVCPVTHSKQLMHCSAFFFVQMVESQARNVKKIILLILVFFFTSQQVKQCVHFWLKQNVVATVQPFGYVSRDEAVCVSVIVPIFFFLLLCLL